MTCALCHDDEEIMVRRAGGGVMPLSCPACYGLAPREFHEHAETFDDAVEACELRGVAPKFLTGEEVTALDLEDEIQSSVGEWLPIWKTMGLAKPGPGKMLIGRVLETAGTVASAAAMSAPARRAWIMPENRSR